MAVETDCHFCFDWNVLYLYDSTFLIAPRHWSWRLVLDTCGWSTVNCCLWDEVARALARARVLEVFDCVDSIDAPHHDVCVVDGGLTLWGVGVTLVEVPVAADDVTLTTHTTIVVKGAWFECLVLMCSFWRGELRDRFATCCFGHWVVEGCY